MTNHIKDIKTKKLLASNMLFRSASLIGKLFLNIYLIKNTNDIQLVAVFNIILIASHLLSFSFFARIVKFGFRNIIQLIALLGLSLVYLCVMLLGYDVVNFYILLAIGIGFFTGMYWIVYNNNEFDLTNILNRGNYQGLKKSFKTFISIVIPSLIGTIIGLNYFGYGYEISFGIGVVLFILSAFVGITEIEYVKDTKYSMKKALKKVLLNKDLQKINLNIGLMGFSLSNPLISIIFPLLLFSYGMQEMELGFLISFFSILTIITSYLFGKFVGYNKYKLAYTISGFIYILSVLILLIFPVYWYIILFVSLLNLLFTFMDVPQNVLSANIFHEINGYENIKSEYMVIKEWPRMIGQILAFVCIYFIGNFDILGIKILFGVMAFIMLLSIYIFSSIKIKFN